MMTIGARRERIPPAAVVLGGAGLLPLIAGVLLAFAAPDMLGVRVVRVAEVYAALLLSFLGGMHWGLASAALARDPVKLEAPRILGLSVLPSLVGWIALFLPGQYGLLMLAFAFLAVLFLDRATEHLGYAPAWWMLLRIRLTAGVVLLMLLLAAAPGPS
jgi:Protein of unknown function (DUF3429)